MIYYYIIKIAYNKGNQRIIKEYKKSFLEIGDLFCYLEKRHKDNYLLMSIRPAKYNSL